MLIWVAPTRNVRFWQPVVSSMRSTLEDGVGSLFVREYVLESSISQIFTFIPRYSVKKRYESNLGMRAH